MSTSRHLSYLAVILSLLLIFTLVGCKTTPEPEPDDKAVVNESVDPGSTPAEPEPEKPAPLSQEEIDAARSAVQRANSMGANKYFPSEYRGLLADLNDGITTGETDPDAGRAALEGVTAQADALYDKTLKARYDEYVEKISRNDDALRSIEADKFAPEEYEATVKLSEEAQGYFSWEDFAGAQTTVDEALAAQATLYHNLSENIRYVDILKRDTENYLGDAEDNEAFLYAPEELEAANTLYFDGVGAYRGYDLQTSVNTLTEAKRQAVLAARTAAIRKQQAETDDLMTETQRRLEEASGLRVLDADGVVVESSPWDGDEFLADNPLIDHSNEVGDVDIEAPELLDLDAPVNTDGSVPEDIPISDEGTQVNADEQETDYLDFAKTLWEKGVTARNAGQFDLAQDYFRQAQAYIDVYEANAVSKTYTVVWRAVATDCLWRISEMDDIFDDAYLWPKIWRANRKIIQNPDLIYPGQILVIPPK